MLHQFISDNRDRIIAYARATVAQRTAPKPTAEELEHGVPMFLTQLVHILAPTAASTESALASPSGAAAEARGGELLRLGFTVGQVVHDYGEICQAVTSIAAQSDVQITALEFRALNQALDDAVALAVAEYGRQRELLIAERESERMAAFAQELRDLVSSATLAFEVIQRGTVGVGGTTSSLVRRNLSGIRELLDRSLALLRLEQGHYFPLRFPVAMFLEEVEIAAAAEAKQRSIRLAIPRVDYLVEVIADRQILMSAVENLLFNALRYTRVGGEITVRTVAHKDRVTIEIEDECGGLDVGAVERVLRSVDGVAGAPKRRAAGRLSICRRAVEACGGELQMRNRPSRGCVFAIVLPKPAPLN